VPETNLVIIIQGDKNLHRYSCQVGHAVTQWSRHCAINRKVAGSIPNGVIEIFH
jgi:hypothetical protein